jgi:hypothetical protein
MGIRGTKVKKPTSRYVGKKLLLPIAPSRGERVQKRRAKRLASKVERQQVKQINRVGS